MHTVGTSQSMSRSSGAAAFRAALEPGRPTSSRSSGWGSTGSSPVRKNGPSENVRFFLMEKVVILVTFHWNLLSFSVSSHAKLWFSYEKVIIFKQKYGWNHLPIPSSKRLHIYRTLPKMIVDFPMKHGDLPIRYVNVYQLVNDGTPSIMGMIGGISIKNHENSPWRTTVAIGG